RPLRDRVEEALPPDAHPGELSCQNRRVASGTEPSAREWLRRLDAGDCSSRELVEHYQRRIDAVNGTLNAVVAAEPARALAEAGGGSTRVPAHYCGVVGIRPTAGLVPETGVWPSTRETGMLDLLCLGPMARFVEDLALLLPIVAGPDGVDPYVTPVALGDPG